MAEFVIGDVRKVREFTCKDVVNLHLVDGWVLLLVRQGQETHRNYETDQWESVPSTVYVIGWISEDEAKSTEFYKDELRSGSVDASDAADF